MPSSPSSQLKNRGGRDGSPAAAWAGGSGREGDSGVREKREGGERIRSPAVAQSEVARGSLATTAGGDCGGASARFGGGQGVGQKHEGTLGARFPRSPWVGMERGGGATVACGGGLWSSAWRRCGARKEASGGCGGLWCGGTARGSLYRAIKAVEGGARRWWPGGLRGRL